MVILDRVNAEDPRKLLYPDTGTWQAYYPYKSQQDVLNQSKGLKDFVLHTPVNPAITGNTITWPAGPTTVKAIQLTPEFNYSVVDENTATDIVGYIQPEQKAFAVHAIPKIEKQWDVFATVISASEGASTVTSSLLAGTAGEPVTGALVKRSDKPTVAVIGSAKQGTKLTTTYDGHVQFDASKINIITTGRLLTSGFRVTLPEKARLYVEDLDPAKTWTANGVALTKIGDIFTGNVVAGEVEVKPTGSGPISPTPPSPPPPVPCLPNTGPVSEKNNLLNTFLLSGILVLLLVAVIQRIKKSKSDKDSSAI
jgi:hypothetical protein